MSVREAIREIVSMLEQSGIPYMLTGSFASVHYGSPRTTQDIDFVISPSNDQLREFVTLLHAQRYYVDLEASLEANRRRSMFNALDTERGWKIDFIIRKARAFSEEEFCRRKPIRLAGVDLFAATAEDVIISKLEWAKLAESERHIEDAVGVLRMRFDSLERGYIDRWINELGLEGEWQRAVATAGISE